MKLDKCLISLDFTRSSQEHAVYTIFFDKAYLITEVYVDDLIVTKTSDECISEFKEKMIKYVEAPTTEHMAALKRILRYVKGTMNLGLHYRKEFDFTLTGYSDSDHTGDAVDQKSTTGILFFLISSPISWTSQK
ncbi:unnamed protein product [Spirodela intermedia]|uniref:Reverse transcriptase Ty1/copia-type domain-containing protein n=1 Tax=Spirodela intermedia TaxID=51605 RepID=A0A7I8J3T6_SPIIN|nr:unnamed protein product [Spirodela intermedia]CAA6664887.1 unnamed protein product [Spirodela intermedia]